MKIGPEHIGKKVRHMADEGVIVAVDAQQVWLRRDDSQHCTWQADGHNWELVEEPKKPSERIQELFLRRSVAVLQSREAVSSAMVQSIIDYLDEQAAKK